ncbi:MAG: sigma-70 family RNA polymerase sigma factor [Actinobacteria bacterium]|nr:sigma-70 family RNA polymerase sigma factor [Actinomycetota bacterium]
MRDDEGGERHGLPDEELVRAFLEGDREAFEELVRRYHPVVLNMACRLLGNRDDAADVCQEVFILLLRKLGSFRGEAKFSTWLYRVSLNACHDHARRARRHVSLSESPGEDMPEMEQLLPDEGLEGPEESMEREEVRRKVQEAIRRLPPKFKEVIYLHDISGCNYKEVAEILDINLGTVKSRLNRARARLAGELEGYREEMCREEIGGEETD